MFRDLPAIDSSLRLDCVICRLELSAANKQHIVARCRTLVKFNIMRFKFVCCRCVLGFPTISVSRYCRVGCTVLNVFSRARITSFTLISVQH